MSFSSGNGDDVDLWPELKLIPTPIPQFPSGYVFLGVSDVDAGAAVAGASDDEDFDSLELDPPSVFAVVDPDWFFFA